MDEERSIQSICEEALAEIEECWQFGIELAPYHWKKYFNDILNVVKTSGDDRK